MPFDISKNYVYYLTNYYGEAPLQKDTVLTTIYKMVLLKGIVAAA